MPDRDASGLLRELNEAACSGDWKRIEEVAEALPMLQPPPTEAAMNEYLFALQTALISAKTTRADIVKSLHRLSAASSFNQCG